MPPKRDAWEATLAETKAVNKRYRQAIDEVAVEYVWVWCMRRSGRL